ncbi:MAG: manganese efflux pump [Candidatus Sericytochromatia bacterium]
MNLLQPFLLAFSLSLDCFAISISQGIKNNKDTKAVLILALLFGLFQAMMFVFGFYTGSLIFSLYSNFATIVASILLAFIGVKMIKEGLEDEEEEIKVTNIKEYLLLSVATSIDAFAAGISFTTSKESFFITSILVGLVSLIMALIGGFSGNLIGEKFGKRSEIFGGLILIGLAIKNYL